MTQNKTTAVAAIGIVIVLLLICAGTALIVSALRANSDAGAQATATLPVAAATDALPGTEVAAATDAVAATVAAGATLPPPGMTTLPTNTPPPTNTPEPTPLPTDTPVPTEPPPTPTNTPAPVVFPTNPPPPPTATVPPTNTPGPPPAPPPQDARGVTGTFFGLREGQSDNVASAQPIWFHFIVANSSGAPVPFGALGVLPRKGGADRFDLFQASWGNDVVSVNGLDWEDHIDIAESGSYTLRLAICFDVTVDQCRQGQGNWATLSGEIPVTVR